MSVVQEKNSLEESCEQILKSLRSSYLNFIIQESPYSLYITVRKKFLKDSPSILPHKSIEKSKDEKILYLEALVKSISEENVDLQVELKNEKIQTVNLEKNVEDLENEVETIKSEIEKFEKNTVKLNKSIIENEKKIETLKVASKESNHDLQIAKKDLNSKVKTMKSLEKEKYSLNQKIDNFNSNIDIMKAENTQLISDKQKLKKDLLKIEKMKQKSNSKPKSEHFTIPPVSLETTATTSNKSLRALPSSPSTVADTEASTSSLSTAITTTSVSCPGNNVNPHATDTISSTSFPISSNSLPPIPNSSTPISNSSSNIKEGFTADDLKEVLENFTNNMCKSMDRMNGFIETE